LLKRWIDLNYRLIRTQAKVRFLLLCKHNNIFPTHFSQFDTNFFHLNHHATSVKLERVLFNSKVKILKLEISDLNRTCEVILKELSHISWNLFNAIPTYIWHKILKHHAFSFKNSRLKLSRSYNKKFCWLKDSWKRKYITKIKPIKFTYGLNKNELYYVSKDKEETLFTSSEESLLNINIQSSDFSLNQNSLNNNNHKWFINLSNTEIPSQVSYLLQHGKKFSLSISSNKKLLFTNL